MKLINEIKSRKKTEDGKKGIFKVKYLTYKSLNNLNKFERR